MNAAPDKPYGDVDYADPGYQDDGKARYPLDTEAHVRSAWDFINQQQNASLYGKKHLDKIKDRIMKACKKMGIEVAPDAEPDADPDDTTRSSCCPDHLPGEAHVYRREWALGGIDIIRGGQGGDGRTVEAYATPFGVPTEVKDQHGHYMETIHQSAFDDALRGGFGSVKVFYNHGMNIHGSPSDLFSIPIGKPLDIRPDGQGLRTITRYNEGDIGDQILEAIRNQALTGYSFRGPIRQSNPPRVPHARDGQPLPAVMRMKLGLTEYGPTPMPYYAGASILALRSQMSQRLPTLDDQTLDWLAETLATAATPLDQEAIVRAITNTATPVEGPGAEDQPIEALRSASTAAVRRRIAVARILGEVT